MEKDVLISIRGLQYLMDEESGEQEPVVRIMSIFAMFFILNFAFISAYFKTAFYF